ncbi:MAG: hypothetical protein ACRYFX_04690 [Janthinobacterium lividum]
MQTHVTGHPPLGELRQALLAVCSGNPLFSPQEQLQANHQAHEHDDPQALAEWLAALRYEAARRARVAELRQRVQQPAVCTDWVDQMAELGEVLAVRAAWRPADSQELYRDLMRSDDAAFRVRVLGEAYLGLLEQGGFMRCKLLN